MNNNKYLIVYHFEDNDGVCSGALIKYYLVNELGAQEENITMFPANYALLDTVVANDYQEFMGYDNLIMTDISFNKFDSMKFIYEMYGKNFCWIDHHAPIINTSMVEKYDTKINGVRSTSKSAILNAYQYCYDPFNEKYNSGNAPKILVWLSAWDSWTSEKEGLDFEEVRYANTGFTSTLKLDINAWYEKMSYFLFEIKSKEFLYQMLEKGKIICKEMDATNEKLIKSSGMGGFTVNGTRSCIVLFTSGATNSLMFKSVRGEYQQAVCFKSSSTGNIIMSMYNVEDNHEFHCGNYMHDKYKGGGHEGAAGATISLNTFMKILKTKQI